MACGRLVLIYIGGYPSFSQKHRYFYYFLLFSVDIFRKCGTINHVSKEKVDQVISTIRSRLAYEHISQDELAKMIGMEGSTLSNKLTGRYQLKLDELFSIAAALHCDAASLVAGKAPHDAGGVEHDTYTVDQVAQLLGRSRDYVLDLIHTGHLEAIQPVKAYLITRRSYEKFVSKK